MKRTSLAAILTLAASVVMASFTHVSYAQDGMDKATADAFDSRMFAGAPGQKSYACFVRHYDSDHLAHHPKQKVTTMKLLMTAEIPSDEKVLN